MKLYGGGGSGCDGPRQSGNVAIEHFDTLSVYAEPFFVNTNYFFSGSCSRVGGSSGGNGGVGDGAGGNGSGSSGGSSGSGGGGDKMSYLYNFNLYVKQQPLALIRSP